MGSARRTGKEERPRSFEDRWYAEAIAALRSERGKNDAETELARYTLMELRTFERARRTYDLTVEVSDESAAELISTLSDWDAESRDRITVRLMTPGGDIVSGLAIYDFVTGLRAAGTPVDTLALGWAASMGSILLQMGERRYIAPNASVLIHETRTTYDGGWTEKITDAEDRIRFEQDLERRCNAILARRSELTVAELRERYARKDWWLTARETVALGFADELWRPTRRKR